MFAFTSLAVCRFTVNVKDSEQAQATDCNDEKIDGVHFLCI